jgi:ribosomal protein L11 methyltransferase
MGLALDIYDATQRGGQVILSGILTEQAKTVAATFKAAGFEVTPEITLGEWTSLLAFKP